ncbi:phage tail assembly chaperone [Delftia acidovorans]|uniref:phage tail assembly chaperone n=1 Tax=Delftia acidovorans TaxID=80866 RepID=UPI001EDD983A|nr:phage tail assembly chaperone [Delftia acidovorans]MCG3784617.1 phage tail assembly chaperone [Delftia acidovorans]
MTAPAKKADKAAPFILGKRPETISGTIEFPLPDGTSAKLECKFKYRTRKEFGVLWDEIAGATLALATAQQDTAKKDGEEAKFSFAGMFERGDAVNADNVLKYLAAWNEEFPALSKDTLIELFDQAPAAPAALWDSYRQLCTTGRLGN